MHSYIFITDSSLNPALETWDVRHDGLLVGTFETQLDARVFALKYLQDSGLELVDAVSEQHFATYQCKAVQVPRLSLDKALQGIEFDVAEDAARSQYGEGSIEFELNI